MQEFILKVIKNPIKSAVTFLVGLFVFISCLISFFTVEEGHIGIIKQFGKAKTQVDPGLHFKIPYIDSVEIIEIRTRKNEEAMASATKEQMPVKVVVSVNWTVESGSAFDLFIKYGGLTQFENRILDPRFRSATKDAIPKFSAEQLIQERSNVIMLIENNLIEEMKNFPVTVDNIQIENIVLPPKYIASIETKQTEKNLADAEQHKLDRQALTAQQSVNTANAEAQGIEKISLAKAAAIEREGLAEAKAIKAKAKALASNKLIVALTEAQNWDGKLPTTVMGSGGAMPIMDMRQK